MKSFNEILKAAPTMQFYVAEIDASRYPVQPDKFFNGPIDGGLGRGELDVPTETAKPVDTITPKQFEDAQRSKRVARYRENIETGNQIDWLPAQKII